MIEVETTREQVLMRSAVFMGDILLTPAAALELAARLKSAAEGLLPKPPRACGQCDDGLVVGFDGPKTCPRCGGSGLRP
jgi:hypothetical protein